MQKTKNVTQELVRAYKCTDGQGFDFRTGKLNYAFVCGSGQPITVENCDPPQKAKTGDTCGRGLHVSPTAQLTIQFADKGKRPWRWWEVQFRAQDEVERDQFKIRVRRLNVVREVLLTEIFGPDFSERIQRVMAETKTWKSIPWLKPTRAVTDAELKAIFLQWHAAITPWLRDPSYKLPKKFRMVRDRFAADAAVADAADAAILEAACRIWIDAAIATQDIV